MVTLLRPRLLLHFLLFPVINLFCMVGNEETKKLLLLLLLLFVSRTFQKTWFLLMCVRVFPSKSFILFFLSFKIENFAGGTHPSIHPSTKNNKNKTKKPKLHFFVQLFWLCCYPSVSLNFISFLLTKTYANSGFN